MQIKFPKTIIIGATTFVVKQDKKSAGGSFTYGISSDEKATEPTIIIGTYLLKTSPIAVLGTIIHELKEVIQEEQSVRYSRPDCGGDYLFSYTHREHTDFCERLATALSKFIV